MSTASSVPGANTTTSYYAPGSKSMCKVYCLGTVIVIASITTFVIGLLAMYTNYLPALSQPAGFVHPAAAIGGAFTALCIFIAIGTGIVLCIQKFEKKPQ